MVSPVLACTKQNDVFLYYYNNLCHIHVSWLLYDSSVFMFINRRELYYLQLVEQISWRLQRILRMTSVTLGVMEFC